MSYILENAVQRFLDPSVPEWGPAEEKIDPPLIPREPDGKVYPGGGLARHDMLYIGEGCNRIFLVKDGKIIWKYDTGAGWELDDVWMLSNGNILFSRMYWAAEVTPRKEVVWRMDAPAGTEIHALQPIGLNRVALVVNEIPSPRLLIINKATGKTEVDRVIPNYGEQGTHSQNRRFRVTAEGTYLMPFLSGHRVVEYDEDFHEIWSVEVEKPWAAVRLKNGNTLVSDESDQSVTEFRPDKSIAWRLTQEDLGEYRLEGTQSCVRLDNGNTILCARGENGKTAQLVEVTPEKEVVWVMKDWKNFGPATAVQILRDGGVPENPGDCQR